MPNASEYMHSSRIVGGRGLIGSAIVRAAKGLREIDVEPATVNWKAEENSPGTKFDFLSEFAPKYETNWSIIWAAGNFDFQSAPSKFLNARPDNFEIFLDTLVKSDLDMSKGLVLHVSSLGGLYDHLSNGPYDEALSEPPQSSYGKAKAFEERQLELVTKEVGCRSISVRVPAVYGPIEKLQLRSGLINSLALATLLRTPLRVFAPMDTRRPYVYSDDLGHTIWSLIKLAHLLPAGTNMKKNLLPGESFSLAQVLGEFIRAIKISPPVAFVLPREPVSNGVPLEQLSSITFEDLIPVAATPLREGIVRTFSSVRKVLGNEGQPFHATQPAS